MSKLFHKSKTRPWSLRTRLTIILILALLLFQIIMMAITMSMGLLPVMRQAVEDLSERLIDAASHWTTLTIDEQQDYQNYLKNNASLYIFTNMQLETSETSDLIFNNLLSEVLTKKQQRDIKIWSTSISNQKYYWMLLKINKKTIKIGYKHERIGTNPSAVFIALLILNVVFSLLTAFVFVRYITQPLTHLLNAAKSLGQGIKPKINQQNNSREIQDLYNQFNMMSTQVQNLIDNRNTLLIGISHELRTPLTRLTLLLEMARDQLSQSRFTDCSQVLKDMDAIIEQFLSLGRGISIQECIHINLTESLQNIAENFSSERISIESSYTGSINIPLEAFRRVVSNLIDNALKYSGNKIVQIQTEIRESNLTILVLDRGIGIPPEKTTQILQAFVRINEDKQLKVKGLGLGLAISQLISQSNGWTLEFSARTDGGTIVRLKLPGVINLRFA